MAMGRRCAMLAAAVLFALAGTHGIVQARAAGAFAMGQCGAYGEAHDFAAASAARAAALRQCDGACTAIVMRRACAAFAIDLANPCGAHGYAVRPRISTSLNEATRECYKFGGKQCVIRAWACDAKG